jgi:hypothetical protein
VYLLYLDESGTHGNSPVAVLGGLAVHEQDAWFLQKRLDAVLSRLLPEGLDPALFELHATDLKTPAKATKSKPASPWLQIPPATRLHIVHETYRAIATFKCADPAHPCVYFGAVIDGSYRDRWPRAYEEVLHRFDEMLTRQAPQGIKIHQRGIAIHDNHVLERDVQSWVAEWRHAAGRIGVLTHLSDVPLFADSQASRLIQAADFVCWALWRYYSQPTPDEQWIKQLWAGFDHADGKMHGLVHVNPAFARGGCRCPPCASRA